MLGRAEAEVLGRAEAAVLGRAAPGMPRGAQAVPGLRLPGEVRALHRTRLHTDPQVKITTSS